MRNVFLCTVLFTAFAVPIAAQTPDPERVTVPLSDPGRPGSLQIDIVMGSIAVKGTNRKDMLIEARGNSVVRPPRRRRSPDEPPPPGLRRLTQNTPFTVEEDRNEVSVNVESATRSIDFVIEVPLRTNLEVETVMGSITVEGVEGELEIESVNGEVTLTNVGGSVVAHTVNGKLLATITRAMPQQPMAFTSLNGSVDVTLPANVKANLKLRSDQGDVYTDFDLQQAVDAGRNRGQRDNGRPRDDQGRRRVEIDNAIYGSINGGGPDFEMRTFNGNVYVRKGK
jgi:DUF4097 and DUF4098 domain-containing protein YvlB